MMRFMLILLAFSCCNPKPEPPVVTPHRDDTSFCAEGCAHLAKLGCEEGQPLEDGTTCATFCEQTQRAGSILAPSCWLTITTCAEIDQKCSIPRKPE